MIFFTCVALLVNYKIWAGADADNPPSGENKSLATSFTVKRQSAAAVEVGERVSPWLKLQPGKLPETTFYGKESAIEALRDYSVKPQSQLSVDFNFDGYPDLIGSFSKSGGGGLIALHRANREAFEPRDAQVLADLRRGMFPTPFEKEAAVVELPVSPDFMVAGKFVKDSMLDLVFGSRGGRSLYLMSADGQGGFGEPREIAVNGEVTALAADLFDGSRPYAGLAVGLEMENTSGVLVFEGRDELFGSRPVFHPVEGSVRSLILANPDNSSLEKDLYVLADGRLLTISRFGTSESEVVPVDLPFRVADFAVGEFISDRQAKAEIAVLSESGTVSYLTRGTLDTRPVTTEEMRALHRKYGRGNPVPADKTVKFESAATWTVAEEHSLAVYSLESERSLPLLQKARLTGNETDDLLVVNPQSGEVQILFKEPRRNGREGESFTGATKFHSVELGEVPAAVQPMRLNVMGQQGFAFFGKGGLEPSTVVAAPEANFTVTTTIDENNGACSAAGTGCSLREAIIAANAAAGADMITIPSGTFQLTIAGANENASATGDLDITDALTIIGNGTGNTIIQAGTNATNGIDKIFSVNPLFNAAFATSISGLTIRYGRNPSAFNGDGFGGGLDWEGSGTGTISISNTTVDQNSTTDGRGGGLVFTQTPAGGGSVTVTSSTISNNIATRPSGAAAGGGIFVGFGTPYAMTTIVIDNNSTTSPSTDGGGLFMFALNNTGGSSTFTGITITNNDATNDGGGMLTQRGLTINPPFTLSNNTTTRWGGGMSMTVFNTSVNISKATMVGNSAGTAGGAIEVGAQTIANGNVLNMSFSRIIGNAAPTNNGLVTRGGAANVESNWWGCNTGPSAGPCDRAGLDTTVATGTLDFDPWLQLRLTASPNTTPVVGESRSLTASFLLNSAGGAVAASNLDVLIGQTVTWSASGGTISPMHTMIQSSGTANATFTATAASPPNRTATAQVDNGPATVNFTVGKANTTLSNLTDSPDPSVTGQAYTVGFSLSVAAPGVGTPTGTVTVTDGTGGMCTATLPSTSCMLTGTSAGAKTLTFTYGGDANFNGTMLTTSHTVNKADTTTTITGESADPTTQGDFFTVFYTVTVNLPGAGTPTGNVTVSDGADMCVGTVAAGQCSLTLNTPGVRTLTATYGSDANFNGSVSPGVPHTVIPLDSDPPETMIDSNPPNPSASSSATFTFSGTDIGTGIASFECKLDAGSFAVCTSPQNYMSLADGSHTFMVRAVDGAGNKDASSASFTWTIDTTAPDTTITAHPTDPSSNGSASFSFFGTDASGTGVASFECQLDGGGYSPCTSPQTYNALADGSHSFMVRAIDHAGNTDASPAGYTWTIDTAPPDTSINSTPSNPSASSSASFAFSGTDSGTGIASFECQLDSGGFSACASPKNYAGLSDGSHTFQVRAVDGTGNTDPTPASFTWTVDTDPPDVAINQAAGQADPANGMGISIHFTAVFNEPVTGFTASDVMIGGSANPTSVAVTETAPMNGTTFDVAVSGMPSGGTVTASIPAGRAQDATGNPNTASTSADNTVTYVPNTPPTAVPDSYATVQDTALAVPAPGVLSNDSDPDAGNTITAVLVSGPAHAASFALNADGSFSYTPAACYTGTDSFSYKARDNFGADSSAVTVTLNVRYRFAWVSYSGYFDQYNEQGLNQVTAGGNVPIRFTLHGYKGNPYSQAPTSQPINCSTMAPTGAASAINRYMPDPYYSSVYDYYQTTWQTQTSWRFTCRELTLHLADGTTRKLKFYFK